jgi:putative redox protein
MTAMSSDLALSLVESGIELLHHALEEEERMATEMVQTQWVEDRLFLLQDRFGFPLVMTQPNGVNGADLLPLSLIGCAAWDVIDILQKQRQVVLSLRVTAESEREEEPPWRFKRIHIRYHLRGSSLSADRVQRAIELTEGKYCSIYATLRQAIELTSDYQIEDE